MSTDRDEESGRNRPPRADAAGELELQTVEVETAGQPGAKTMAMQACIDSLLELPTESQLSVLRTVVPHIVASLDAHSRESFLASFGGEIRRAIAGEEDEQPDVAH